MKNRLRQLKQRYGNRILGVLAVSGWLFFVLLFVQNFRKENFTEQFSTEFLEKATTTQQENLDLLKRVLAFEAKQAEVEKVFIEYMREAESILSAVETLQKANADLTKTANYWQGQYNVAKQAEVEKNELDYPITETKKDSAIVIVKQAPIANMISDVWNEAEKLYNKYNK